MGGENKNGPKRRQTRLWATGTFFFKYKYYLFIVFITTTACAHDTPANAIPLACKYEPGLGFSSPTSNQHHTPSSLANVSRGWVYSPPPPPPPHLPRSQTRAKGGFTLSTPLAFASTPPSCPSPWPPLPSHSAWTSYKRSSGLSIHISTALAFASTSDKLQALVWALHPSRHFTSTSLPSH